MGANIKDVKSGVLVAEANKLIGKEVHLDFPSVGATENIMLAAVGAEGETIIRNAAKEPEIIDLQNFLNSAGAEVSGAGTGFIKIKGNIKPKDEIYHNVMPDRIVAGTYLVAAAMTSGDLILNKIVPEHIASVIAILRDCGCDMDVKSDFIHIKGVCRPKAIDIIRTLPFPGFPTDMQAQIVTMLSLAEGTSVMVETIFESRFKYIDELLRMGANINVHGKLAIIKGVESLKGANVSARDLRGGASLILAGLAAEGETTVHGVDFIDRGYDSIETKLEKLGADIRRV
jgi:UDP-N-acetylglucosamine 1-carboxyvinyltransferase